MTDRELDTLMKKALAPEENPPEIKMPSPVAKKHKHIWPTLIAACLCLVVSASVAVYYSPAFDVKNVAAPESAHDNFMSTDGGYNGTSSNNYGSLTDQSNTESENQIVSDQELADPSSPNYAGALGTPLLIPYATAREQSLIREEAEARLGAGELKYTLMGKTERWLSVKVTNSKDTVYLNIDRRSQSLASLADVLQDETLANSFHEDMHIPVDAEYYVNSNNKLIIVQ